MVVVVWKLRPANKKVAMEQRDTADGHREPMLTLRELAKYVGVDSPNTVRAMVRRGELPPAYTRIAGRFPRWKPADVDAWMDRRKHEAAVEERLAADDPVGAKNELAKLERAAGARDRDAS